jgi:polysaccharide pyruvyl transferase WcaK-like protein/chemotaxis methyl-accepting protein methylase
MRDLRVGRRIGIFGHFGDINFGNESTLQAMLYHLRRYSPAAEVTCICTDPAAVAARYRISAVSLNGVGPTAMWLRSSPLLKLLRWFAVAIPTELYRWFKAFMVLRRIDSVIVPGTGLLTDVCGLRSWGPYNLFKWSIAAKVCRCRLLFVGVGAGPIYSPLGRWFVKSALAAADFRSYRDTATKAYLCSIGFPASDDEVHPDLAFSLPESFVPSSSLQAKKRPVVGLGLMLYAGRLSLDKPSHVIYAEYMETLVQFVSWLLAHGYDVRLLIGDVCDQPVIQQFRDLLIERKMPYDADRIIYEPIHSVESLLLQLSRTDLVFATRFHNVLLALILNKPVVSISFHQKCVSLMSYMGLSEYCEDITTLKADRLIERFIELQGNAHSITELIKQKTTEFRRELDLLYSVIFGETFCRYSEAPTEADPAAQAPSKSEFQVSSGTCTPAAITHHAARKARHEGDEKSAAQPSRRPMDVSLAETAWSRAIVKATSRSATLRRFLGRPYLRVSGWVWTHFPPAFRLSRVGRGFGKHLHWLVQLRATRKQHMGTFFFRNRPELELLGRVLKGKEKASKLKLAILGCSKGAEVYSYLYSIRQVRPDLIVSLSALDIDPGVLQFAEEGIYSLESRRPQGSATSSSSSAYEELTTRTFGDQRTSVFERMSSDEIAAMFDCQAGQARVKAQFREGIAWQLGDAGDPELVDLLGLQDVVVANRFLCHMQPEQAETCLRALASLVKPGGYLFVSGVDLDVRTRVAKDLGWVAVTELIEEIHEGDPSLRRDWPLQYWGLEPFDPRRSDRDVRYASVFRLGESRAVDSRKGVRDNQAQMCEYL